MSDTDGYQDVSSAIDRFVEALHEAESPFEFATTLVKATAQQYHADIATLFRVSPSRTELIAEAGYDKRGEPLRTNASYSLPWMANSQADMPGGGLTPWVAVSGKPLYISSAAELLDKNLHPAHKGTWDSELHPAGAEVTFGCMYAVPLRIGGRLARKPPHESVVGVYKIERRSANPHGTFTLPQLREFDLAAKQLSLVILLYEQAMARILSDARHAVMGRLADAISELDAVAQYLPPDGKLRTLPTEKREHRMYRQVARVKADTDKVQSWLRQSIRTYMHPYENEQRNLGEFVADTIESRANQQCEVTPVISATNRGHRLELNAAQSWDLHTLLLCLLNNAIKHSESRESVTFSAEVMQTNNAGTACDTVFFTISDAGRGIPADIIAAARAESEGARAQALTASHGTGLRRAFQVAKMRQWDLVYEPCQPGSLFRISVTSGRRSGGATL